MSLDGLVEKVEELVMVENVSTKREDTQVLVEKDTNANRVDVTKVLVENVEVLVADGSILFQYWRLSGANIGEYPVSPVIGPLSASCFAPRIAGTGRFFDLPV